MDERRQAQFEAQREAGRALAYRMTGSASDVDDVMQEAWLRWEGYAGEIERPRSFMLAVVSRLCLDAMGSARARRERYVGPWLPEPVRWQGDSPEEAVMMRESITLGFLRVLEALSPRERAVFLLRRVFEVEHVEIGGALEISEEASRQLYKRASERFEGSRAPVNDEESAGLLGQLMWAVGSGEVGRVQALLREGAVCESDGGGRVSAATRPVVGAERVAKLLVGITSKGAAGASAELMQLNGAPALVYRVAGRVAAVISVEGAGGKIGQIYIRSNPDKLSAMEAWPIH